MPNDDLGQFPSPTSTKPDESTLLADLNATPPAVTPSLPPSVLPEESTPPVETAPTFEETPEEIPSAATPPVTPTPVYSAPAEPVYSQPTPATVPTPKGGSAFGSLIGLVLLLISGIALAVTVFLFSQSQQLKKQLGEVTQTLEQQRTTITPSPTPTIIEFVTPTPESTESGLMVLPTATPSAAPTATVSAVPTTVLPLADAAKALKVAINHLPNAQLLIIKTENATLPALATTKYYFRQDLTTKKYFFVLITGNKAPEIADKAIYVTPDNNIPSLNDLIAGNKLGVDLDEALRLANAVCTSKLCDTATVKAQYIQSGTNLIWQLSFDPVDANKSPLILQLNATTKEILYKSPGF